MRIVTVSKRQYRDGKWVVEHDFTGKFHQWGLEMWEQEPASVSFTVAIVEREDGTISTVPPHMVKFEDGGAA